MCTRLRCSLALLLFTIVFASAFETSASTKKKPKRRNTRTNASKKVVTSLVLPAVIPTIAIPKAAPDITVAPQTVVGMTGRDATVNGSSTQSGLHARPVRADEPPTSTATATAGQL